MRIRALCKEYQVAGKKLKVLKNLNLDADDHSITVVLGRSGCGKTTLLRLAAGLEAPDSGKIEMGTEEEKDFLDFRKIGVIFQEPRLMPWLTIEDNILFGIGKRGKRMTERIFQIRSTNKSRDQELDHLLELTKLRGFEKAYPSQLSGGMQQRAALARALAYGADYLLMDEPFAALDYFTRKKMQQELLRIYETEQKGILFVTHSIDEALTIGRKIVVLEDGICRKEYNLEAFSYPRDLLSPRLSEIKKDIIRQIQEEQIVESMNEDEGKGRF